MSGAISLIEEHIEQKKRYLVLSEKALAEARENVVSHGRSILNHAADIKVLEHQLAVLKGVGL